MPLIGGRSQLQAQGSELPAEAVAHDGAPAAGSWSAPALHSTRLYGDMGEFLETFFGDLEGARRRVFIECFIVRADKLGQSLAEALGRAAARGVEVWLLYDPMGSRATPPAFFEGIAARGVRVRSFGRQAGRWARFWPRSRNHSRIYVVDDAAYTGGHAWGDEWLPIAHGGGGWQDVCCRVEGPVVEDFARLFGDRWNDAARTETPVGVDTGERYPDVRLISDAPERAAQVYGAYLQAFASARQRIWVANSYCFPPRGMLVELSRAAARGVDVRLCLPGKSDIPIIRRAARAEYAEWLSRGIGVWEYQRTVMHAKYALVDDGWCAVGSFNANASSLALSIEIALCGRDPTFVAAVARQYQFDLESSSRVTHAAIAGLPAWDRALDSLAHAAMATADAVLDRTPTA